MQGHTNLMPFDFIVQTFAAAKHEIKQSVPVCEQKHLNADERSNSDCSVGKCSAQEQFSNFLLSRQSQPALQGWKHAHLLSIYSATQCSNGGFADADELKHYSENSFSQTPKGKVCYVGINFCGNCVHLPWKDYVEYKAVIFYWAWRLELQPHRLLIQQFPHVSMKLFAV